LKKAAASAGVHAILGPDAHLAEEGLAKLLEAAVGSERGDAVEALRGDETTWGRLIETARTGSLFAPRRAVVVRGADGLKGDGEEIAGYLDDPSPGVTLIFMAPKVDKRKPVWRLVLDRATVTPADPLKGRALRAHVVEHVRQRKLALADDALQELLDAIGPNLGRLSGELEKLEAFAGGGKAKLGAEEVASLLGRGPARPLYRLSDAIAARETGLALELLEESLDEGEQPLRILGALHRSLRQVRGARALRDQRVSRDELATRLGIFPFKVGDVLQAADRWSDAELARAVRALDRADWKMKGGADARVALVAAVAGTGRPGAARSAARAR
jgi:DNA polymerase-3 subunit delta